MSSQAFDVVICADVREEPPKVPRWRAYQGLVIHFNQTSLDFAYLGRSEIWRKALPEWSILHNTNHLIPSNRQPGKTYSQISNLGVGIRRTVPVQSAGCLLGPTADAIIRMCLLQGGESLREEVLVALVDGVELRTGVVDAALGSPGFLDHLGNICHFLAESLP